jgi:TolB-like protein/Tfp pilus assembly protein PilF
MAGATRTSFLKELRRRRVFRVAGLYVVGVWLVMQVADIVFPAWDIPDAAIRVLLWAALLGFPVALVFGWVFDISTEGIRRTQPVGSEEELLRSLPLRRADYLILMAFLVVVGAIVYDTTGRVMQTAAQDEALRAGEWRPAAAEVEQHSVAVLPFASLSTDPEHEYFADGISEEILNRLAAFGELTVIARTSSFAFKDSGYDIGRISGLLAVNYLLQGSVRRDGQQLRISAQLVDRSGVQVWSSSFDRALGGIFQLQDEIAEAVANSIVPQIVPPAPLAREPDLEAYQEYLIGRELLSRRPAMFARDSYEHFTRAIELDPGYAEPYAARAVSRYFGLHARMTEGHISEVLVRAETDVQTALALKSDLGSAYASQALLLQLRDPASHAQREALLRQALELDPHQADALNWLSGAVSAQGRMEEAEEIQRRALRIDPLHVAINVNTAGMAARRGEFAAAERQLRRLMEMPRPSAMALDNLFHLQLNMGQIANALETGKRIVMQQSPALGYGAELWLLALPYAHLGMMEHAEHWSARAGREQPSYHAATWRPQIMSFFAGHIDYGEALAEFEAVLEARGVDVGQLPPVRRSIYVTLLSLSGAFDKAIQTLPSPDIETGTIYIFGAEALPAIAWAYLRTGDRDEAMGLLGPVIARDRHEAEAGRLRLGYDLYGHALAVLLSGDREGALELLARAADAGWRGYHGIRRDPRWDSVRETPMFKAIMARVKSDLDAQRAEVEAIDAEDNFIARLDAAIALHAADEPPAGTSPPQNQ